MSKQDIKELEKQIPPLQNEPNQAEIDAEQARKLREGKK